MQIKYGIKAVIIVVVGCGLRVANPREDEILIAARNNSCQQHVGDWPPWWWAVAVFNGNPYQSGPSTSKFVSHKNKTRVLFRNDKQVSTVLRKSCIP